jgi:hypothetical protein
MPRNIFGLAAAVALCAAATTTGMAAHGRGNHWDRPSHSNSESAMAIHLQTVLLCALTATPLPTGLARMPPVSPKLFVSSRSLGRPSLMFYQRVDL